MLPLSTVRLLCDFDGQFLLSVQCLQCRHERPLQAWHLARIAGRDAPVLEVVRRLRCSQCGARRVDVQVAGIPR
ncbi:MAG: hypothetical protein ABW278_11340 [Steroidobacteraceae bacterium]